MFGIITFQKWKPFEFCDGNMERSSTLAVDDSLAPSPSAAKTLFQVAKPGSIARAMFSISSNSEKGVISSYSLAIPSGQCRKSISVSETVLLHGCRVNAARRGIFEWLVVGFALFCGSPRFDFQSQSLTQWGLGLLQRQWGEGELLCYSVVIPLSNSKVVLKDSEGSSV